MPKKYIFWTLISLLPAIGLGMFIGRVFHQSINPFIVLIATVALPVILGLGYFLGREEK